VHPSVVLLELAGPGGTPTWAVIGSCAGERQTSREMKVTAWPRKVMIAAAVVAFLIAVAVKATFWPFAVFVVPGRRLGSHWMGDPPPGRPLSRRRGWTPSTPSPRSASSQARDRRSTRRHASCYKAGRPAPAPDPGRALVGSDCHTSSPLRTRSRRALIIRWLRADLLGVCFRLTGPAPSGGKARVADRADRLRLAAFSLASWPLPLRALCAAR
jgi:hypothetical protein